MSRLTNSRLAALVGIGTLLLGATPAGADAQRAIAAPTNQSEIARADALLKAGRVEAAEALYYREARRRPRDPAARLALGRYLASRGATRIGAVLIEEARFFGASPAVAAIHLAPLYARLGDYKALALLPAAPLSAGDRARAVWLAKNPPNVLGPDSVTVALTPPEGDSTSVLGRVAIVVDGGRLIADVDPAVRGLVLDTSRVRTPSVRVFSGPPTAVQAGPPAIAAVLLRARLGTLSFTNFPVSLEPLESPARARIGLDVLARYSPTFLPKEGRLVLRRSGRIARSIPGERVPLLIEPRDSWVVWEGRPQPLAAEVVTRRLRSVRWTLDAKRGEIVLQS
jgi:tetratricopeptide (TPR) repeat protein